jgi:outer membrane protein assembly factor BamB/tetratricopeptide (TPR) repeat protein
MVLITQAIGQGQAKVAQQPGGKGRPGPGVEPAQPPPHKEPNQFSTRIDLPYRPEAGKKLEAAQDYLEDGNWATATDALQDLLLDDQNYFTKVERNGPEGKKYVWVSVKSEANRLLSQMKPEGKKFYEDTFGPKAKDMLKEAKETGDIEKLAAVTTFYVNTDAGAEALNLLGTHKLDRGEYGTAALYYDKLINREGSNKLSAVTLYKAAFAFHVSGDQANEKQCWQKLNQLSDGVKLGNQTRTVSELQAYVAKATNVSDAMALAYGTPWVGGKHDRNAQYPGGPLFFEKIWKVDLFRTSETKDNLARAESVLAQRGQFALPAFQPITVSYMKEDQKKSVIVVRSNYGVHAVDMRTGKVVWETASNWSMDRMFRDNKNVGYLNNWLNTHLSVRPNILFENSTVGTLSSDGTYVFAVDDLQVPPAQGQQIYDGTGRVQPNYGGDGLTEAVASSRLLAFDVATGKLKWELGGKPKKDGTKRDELTESYFLGAPMPLAGKLYVMTEKQQDLRLATIDPNTGNVLQVQTLATARDKMMADTWRRAHASHLAYGEGILVCPTNAGAILGVDLLSNSLVWAYPYHKKDDPNEPEVFDPRRGKPVPPGWQIGPDGQYHNPNLNTKWKVSPPVIVDGKVVFTAPDANGVHCINLRDGSPVWDKDRIADSDLYLGGVFQGKVLVVGKGYVRALGLAKGEQLWRVETGTPSGYGVASDNVYYLPLKDTAKGSEPEICAIDIEKGVVKAHTKSRKKEVPGSLAFFDGNVISQTATELVAYPQLEVQIAKSDEALKKDPNNPVGLFLRGQLRMDKGDLGDAILDLRNALKNNPDDTTRKLAREKLYEAFTDYFQRDFNKAEEYIKEYEEICKVEIGPEDSEAIKTQKLAEQRRRRSDYLCLVAKGKESQGKLVEAFEKYQEFASEAADKENKDQLLPPTVDEPNVRSNPEVWAGGRIAAMIAKAKPDDKKPLEALINKKWDEIKKTEDVNEIRNFVRVFGSLFTVGKEARLELANRLMDDASPLALLEAEQQLTLLRVKSEDPKLAGRAVETLARLNTRKGLLEDASYYYRVLRDEFAKVPVRDGKTGADLFNDMATDKRLLPHLDVPGNLGVTGKYFKVDEQRGNFPYNAQVYEFGHTGEELPFFQRHRVGLGFNYHQLKIVDRSTGEEKTKNLTRTNFQALLNQGNGLPTPPKYNYMSMGHLVVLPVANMVYGIDAVRGEVLWERDLAGAKNQGQPPFSNSIALDPKDGSVVIVWPDPWGWTQRVGGPGTLEGSALVLQTKDGLLAIDPVTNKTLWTRSGVGSNNQVFTDDQYVYVVEMRNDGQTPTSTRVLRAYDGVSVEAKDFTSLYQKRVRQIGRKLLLSETDGKGQLTYRLYDVLTGEDLWSTSYPANSTVLKSEDPNFGGVIEPDGTVRVTDIRTGKEAMKAKMDPKFLEKMASVHLLYDGQYFVVACNGQLDPNKNPWGVQTNLLPGTGMRGLPVNGEVYCFDAQTGRTKWHSPLMNQQIVLDHFGDMPILLATSRYNGWVQVGAGRQVQQIVPVEAIAKASGKYVYKQESQNGPQFHGLNLDPKKGTIEFVSWQSKVVIHVSNDAPEEKK